MAKHWKMQAVVRDPDTYEIIKKCPKCKTFPPEVGKMLVKKHPGTWVVVDKEWEVPDDTRFLGKSPWHELPDTGTTQTPPTEELNESKGSRRRA